MKYKSLLVLLLFFFTALFIAARFPSPVKQTQKLSQPNMIIIMADDLDSRQLSCYGGKNITTPNIDGLAAEGLKFNQIFASEAMCVPIRASLFTGLYPMRHGSFQNHKPVYDDKNIKSVCQYLDSNGYKVGLTGKNHSTTPRTVFPFQIIKGFETNCLSTTDNYYLDSVKQFITKKDKPYCLFVMSINPHIPWSVGNPAEFNPDKLVLPPNWVDTKVGRNKFCKYLAEVRELDNQVGDILKMLKNTGQDQNTMVVFLGEQGPEFPGGKWTSWDYGQKSSMIARLYGKIKPGTETNAIVQYEDITPTLIDIAGGKPVAGLDGHSFLPVLYGKSNQFRDYGYGIHNNIPEGTAYSIRSVRDTKYKLILNLSAPEKYYNQPIMNPAHKNSIWASWVRHANTDNNPHDRFIVQREVNRPGTELYNMQADPYELQNLAGDTKYKSIIAALTLKLKEWMKQQGDAGAVVDRHYPNTGNDKAD